MIKKKHPTFQTLYATDDGKIYYENGNPIATNYNGSREKFAVKIDGKIKNFGLRRFIWECMTGEELDRKYVIVGKNNSNHYKDLQCITKSEHASKIYTEIWKKKREQKTK